MKIVEAERWLKGELLSVYDAREGANIAAWVLEKVTGLSRMDRLTNRDEPLVVQQLHHLTEIVQRLQQHEPVQYVLSESYFGDLKLYVDKNVLIPRPETEELVAWVIEDVRAQGHDVFEKKATEADATTELKILDVGTGSGCIALSLKKAMPMAEVWGCDVSEGALNVARRNSADLDIRVDFLGLDFLDESQRLQLPMFHIVISNPPYIPLQDKETMQPNVVLHEPHTALFVPDNNALIFYEALARFGKKHLHPQGAIYMEIHENLSSEVTQLFNNAGYKNVLVKKDMQGKDRMVKAFL